jgi:hypothetical protein
MLSKKGIEALAGALKLNVEDLTKVLTSQEEQDLELPKLEVFTETEFESFKENLKDSHGKAKYDEGKTASREMLLKEMSKEVGFETSVKDPNEFINKFKNSILETAKVEPNKKVQELETSLSNLQSKLDEKDNEISKILNQTKEKETRFKVQSLFPDLSDKIGLNQEDMTTLFFNKGYEIKDDGVYKDGQILKDARENTLKLNEVVTGFISERKWNVEQQPSGRGGGAQGKGGSSNLPTSLAEYESYIKEKGIAIGSVEANALLREVAKAEE